jgi:Flp pilus assembly pilin Flp
MTEFLRRAWRQEVGQDVAEYAVMLAVILATAIGTIRLIMEGVYTKYPGQERKCRCCAKRWCAREKGREDDPGEYQ